MSKKHKRSQSVSSPRKGKPSQTAQRRKRNNLWVSLGFSILAVIAVVLLAKPKSTQLDEISPAQAYQKYQQGALILDVRSREEWSQSHIEGSQLIPLDGLEASLSELPRDREIVVVCRSGNRIQAGLEILKEAGFSNAFSMRGGMIAWEEAGYPVESSSP